MSNFWLFILVWVVLSFLLGPLIGKMIAFCSGSDEEMETKHADLQ